MAAEARETGRTSKNEYNLGRGMGQTGWDDPRMVRIDARKGIDGQARAEHIVHCWRREELAGSTLLGWQKVRAKIYSYSKSRISEPHCSTSWNHSARRTLYVSRRPCTTILAYLAKTMR